MFKPPLKRSCVFRLFRRAPLCEVLNRYGKRYHAARAGTETYHKETKEDKLALKGMEINENRFKVNIEGPTVLIPKMFDNESGSFKTYLPEEESQKSLAGDQNRFPQPYISQGAEQNQYVNHVSQEENNNYQNETGRQVSSSHYGEQGNVQAFSTPQISQQTQYISTQQGPGQANNYQPQQFAQQTQPHHSHVVAHGIRHQTQGHVPLQPQQNVQHKPQVNQNFSRPYMDLGQNHAASYPQNVPQMQHFRSPFPQNYVQHALPQTMTARTPNYGQQAWPQAATSSTHNYVPPAMASPTQHYVPNVVSQNIPPVAQNYYPKPNEAQSHTILPQFRQPLNRNIIHPVHRQMAPTQENMQQAPAQYRPSPTHNLRHVQPQQTHPQQSGFSSVQRAPPVATIHIN